jgi:isopentenyl diphosphate isomerase/L-lactate dehydrogenase-like FMN-dependent dehydrogenase
LEFRIQDTSHIKPSRRIFATQDAVRIARRSLPRLVFDFIAGSAGREVGTKRNSTAFDAVLLQPRVMEDVSNGSLEINLLGRTYSLPFGIAPMGMCNLARRGADKMLADMAKRHNVPVCLSSAASSSIEEMHDWAGENAWFQLYVGQSIEHSMTLVSRAQNAGYETLVLTVDVPQVARRVRDLRNGFEMPFKIGLQQFIDLALHPRWSLATLSTGAPYPKNFGHNDGEKKFDRHASRAGADWKFLAQLRQAWKGNLVVKGITSPHDALRVKECGVDVVYVSNHGGRQLDGAPAAIDILPSIRAAVGPDYPLIFDSGVRDGEDVVKALALGADFVMVGRPWLYALAAEGKIGLNALFGAFASDISTVMAQLGIRQIDQIGSDTLYNKRVHQAHSAQQEPRQND